MNANKKNNLMIYVKGLASGKYTYKQAMESTGYSKSGLWQLKKKYLQCGAAAFENKNKGRVPVNKISQQRREQIAAIYAGEYSDVNFAYFQECLQEFENIKISKRTLSNILHEYGMKSPERRKVKNKVCHRPRLRRECEGDMLQIDGTPYPWFYKSGDHKKYCMVGSIDDATGKITALYITENECLYGYMEILRQTCRRYGVPREIYSDRAAIFCVTPKGKNLAQWEKLEVMHEKRTQWQRILEELNINQILAWSPEAKGRVERMWHTLQGQLPIWFFKHGIKTIEQANKELEKYINEFNDKYSVPAAVDDPFYIEPPENLDDILCAQFPRRFDRNGCINFQSSLFYAPTAPDLRFTDVTLCISEAGLFAKHKGVYYPLIPIGGRVQQLTHDPLPQVVVNIIYRYLYAYGKEVSA